MSSRTKSAPADAKFISARQVKARYGDASDMWLHRHMKNDGFPKPVRFGSKARYWHVPELDEWDRERLNAR